jgi:probable rRNA maturation factor
MMKLRVFNHQKDLSIRVASVKPIVEDVLESEKCLTDELSVYFVSTTEICRLHQEFFNDPSPTDCLSFPIDAKGELSHYHILGEVFICPKTALDYDERSPYQEVTLYLVHGLLHLLGYDDTEANQRRRMREAEKRHMERLCYKKLLLKRSLV